MLSFIRSDLAHLHAYAAHAEAVPDSPQAPVDHLDTNECPYDLPETLKQKLTWTYEHEISANRYPDGGHESLKFAIAEYVNESAGLSPPQISAQHISLGNGSDELIRSVLIATCIGGQGSMLVANPTFSMYGILAQTLGIPVISVERSDTDFAIDTGAATQAIAQAEIPVRVVFVVHPNSPTANALTPTELAWLKQLPNDILIVIDEAYFEFSQSSVVAELATYPNWLILRTFSKAFRLAAHRVGYAIAHPEMIAALEKIRLPYNLPSFTQAAALTALNHRERLLAVIPELLQAREQLQEDLCNLPGLRVWPSAANFIFVRRPLDWTPVDPRSAQTLSTIQQQLQAQGTRIRFTGGGLRITVGSPAENQRTLARLQAVLQDER